VQARLAVSEVIGSLSFSDFSEYIRSNCGKQGKEVTVEELQLRSLPSGRTANKRAEVVLDNGKKSCKPMARGCQANANLKDYEINTALEKFSSTGDYTVIYFSDPNEFQAYEAEFVDPVHIELRRQSAPVHVGRRQGNVSDNAGLFEKYQFFTPGIFMAFIVLFVMLSILYVGLAAIGSLQVSYGAFDKEMGPAAQKKNQ